MLGPQANLHRRSWIGRHPRHFTVLLLLAISLAANLLAVGYYYFLTNVDPVDLAHLAETHVCTPTQYSNWMQSINNANYSDPEQAKKFAAAGVCFTDYDTGRPLDLQSLRPNLSAPPQLPAHP